MSAEQDVPVAGPAADPAADPAAPGPAAPDPAAPGPAAPDPAAPDPAAPGTAAGPPHEPRGFASAGDMVRSLGLILLIVLIAVLLIPRRDKIAQAIDYSGDLRVASANAPFHVLAPSGLGSGWRATSVRYSGSGAGAIWHLGFVTPSDGFAGVDQLAGPTKAQLNNYLHDGSPDGTVSIGGQIWQQRNSAKLGVRSLTLLRPDSTVVVSGTTGYDQLVELASSLR